MRSGRFEELLGLWQDGEASAAELRELEALLRDDPLNRRALVESVFVEVNLYKNFAGSAAELRPARVRKTRVIEALAAILIMGVSILAVGYLLLRPEEPSHVVLAGEVWSDGAPARSIPEGAALEVQGEAPASLRLKDGSRVSLSPGSAATVRGGGDSARQVFGLARGTGTFEVPEDAKAFRVETPAGSVTSRGGAFSVSLQRAPGMETRVGARPRSLGVAVSSGSVQVEHAGASHLVRADERRTFGPPPEPVPAGPPRYRKLIAGASFTLAEAVEKALAVAPGAAVHAALEEDEGRILFAVSVIRERKLREIDLDAKTGAVVEDETEGLNESKVKAPGIPLVELIRKAIERIPGVAVEAEVEREGGRTQAEVKVVGEGRLFEVSLDAGTGKVLGVTDGEAEEEGEKR